MCNAEMYDDGSKWDYMVCPKCVIPLVQRIMGTLMEKRNFPFNPALRVAAFILARRVAPVTPRFPVCGYERIRLSMDMRNVWDEEVSADRG